MAVEKCFRANENKKKRGYGNQVFQIENGSFIPLFLLEMAVWEKNVFGFTKH